MQVLNKSAEDNLGGVLLLYLVPDYNILTQEKNFSTGIYTLTFLDEDKNWLIYCTPESIAYTEEEDDSLGSKFFKCKLEGFIPNDTPTISNQLDLLRNRRFAVVFTDYNGRYKVAGSKTSPLRLSVSFSSQDRMSALRGRNITLEGDTFKGAAFVNNPFTSS